jgi:lipoprotein-releasing system permease protein
VTGLAFHYLLARKRQTLLMLLGVFFGTSCFIALSGLLIGFKEYLVGQLVNNSAHIHIEPAAGHAFIKDPAAWYDRLVSDRRVKAYSPLLISSVVFSKGSTAAPGLLLGCDPARQCRVTTLDAYTVAGRFSDLSLPGNGLALGAELRKSLGVDLGQELLVSSAGGAGRRFRVVAVFKTGIAQSDGLAYAKLSAVRGLCRAPGKVNEIAVKLDDYTQAAAVARAWSGPGPDKAESWDQKNANFVETFRAEDMVRFLSIGAVMLVAAFGIYNVLNMAVVHKRRDIAILRSMGFGALDVLALFFSQGLILGLCGVALGSLAGWGLSLYLRTVSFGGNPMGSGTGHLAVSMDPAIYVQAWVFALLATCVSSALPAWSAARLDPIEIIRAGAE